MARNSLYFKSRYLKQGKNLDNEKDKIEYLEELLVELSRVVSPIEQDMYLSQLSTEFQIGRETIQNNCAIFEGQISKIVKNLRKVNTLRLRDKKLHGKRDL